MSERTPASMDDRTEIEQRINDWVMYRDYGDFDRMRDIWSADGTITTSWFSGSAEEFIDRNRRGFGASLPMSLHVLGGITVDVRGTRAVSQTKMTLSIFAAIDGTACEVTCWGRFYDRWLRSDSAWKLVERKVIYDRDRLTAAGGGVLPALDPDLLQRFPPGYRHLAYTMESNGSSIFPDLPGLTGTSVEELYAHGRSWLDG